MLDGEEVIYKGTYYEIKTNPIAIDSDYNGILDNIDPEPMVYSITDRTLAFL